MKSALENTGFCGCGHALKAMEQLQEILAALATEYPEKPVAIRKIVDKIGDGAFCLIAYWLNAAGLIEHGGSVYTGWPTADGKELLEYINKYGCDTDKWPA